MREEMEAEREERVGEERRRRGGGERRGRSLVVSEARGEEASSQGVGRGGENRGRLCSRLRRGRRRKGDVCITGNNGGEEEKGGRVIFNSAAWRTAGMSFQQ